jgi:hypothetical protein
MTPRSPNPIFDDFDTDNGDSDDTDSERVVRESSDKIRVETKLTRGTGTRDQESHKIKARGETPEEVAEKFDETLSELEDRDVFSRMREIEQEVDR